VSLAEVRDREDWVPERGQVIWIDCNPQAGRDMRDHHPLLVLSSRVFNQRTSLVIGLPMTTAQYTADNPFAVVAGGAQKRGELATSFILCHQPKSFDWRARRARPHSMGHVAESVLVEACHRLNQIIELD